LSKKSVWKKSVLLKIITPDVKSLSTREHTSPESKAGRGQAGAKYPVFYMSIKSKILSGCKSKLRMSKAIHHFGFIEKT